MPIEVVGLRGFPGVMGGVEAHCEQLLPRLAALAPNLDIEVIARTPFVSGRVRRVNGLTIRPLYAPRRQGIEALVSTFLGVVQARRRRARLVHIHGIGPALLSPLARMLGMRVVVTHHSLNYDHQKWSSGGRALLRLGERAAMRFADRVIAVAPWLGRRLERSYPHQAAKVVVIPNGLPTFPDGDGGAVLRELGLVSGGYVLAVGRLVPEKNFDLLIDAMERARRGSTLVLVGDADHATPFVDRLRARARSGIVFAGRRDRGALRTLYENAGLFVLPSLHEGLPIVALEAAHFGCPMLLSDIEPNRDLALPAVHYFRSGDVDDLASNIDQPWPTFATTAGWADRYEWNGIAAATLAIYETVLAKR